MPRKPVWTVVVGNVGTVFTGTNGFIANSVYQSYTGKSVSGLGRVSNEPVTLMRDGEIRKEFIPEGGE